MKFVGHISNLKAVLARVNRLTLDNSVSATYCRGMRDEALIKAIHAAGGPAALAAELKITSQAISQWKRAPADRVVEIVNLCAGAVSRHDLRADIYPEAAT